MRLTLQNEDSKFARQLTEDVQRIEQYVEMVLNYLRLGSDSTDYVICRVELDRLLHQSVKKYAKQFIRRRIRLDYKETGLTVLTDEKWLSFAIEQLLANALKYTREGGGIRIYAEGEALCIEDTGIGIAPEDRERIFERFVKLDTFTQGTGLGLSICKSIAEQLGGSVGVDSVAGEGSCFRIDIPAGE